MNETHPAELPHRPDTDFLQSMVATGNTLAEHIRQIRANVADVSDPYVEEKLRISRLMYRANMAALTDALVDEIGAEVDLIGRPSEYVFPIDTEPGRPDTVRIPCYSRSDREAPPFIFSDVTITAVEARGKKPRIIVQKQGDDSCYRIPVTSIYDIGKPLSITLSRYLNNE